ncbi:MAG: ATP-dependent Clp protease adaptor protein ClpS [Vicingaceae bacterium]|jgi:ATP-dependent Clp protease adaptor protein ClpS
MSTQELEEVELKKQVVQERELILHNDDFNTFEHVINCLVSYCEHKEIQAEQCAYIVHHNGKCSVKKGPKSALEPIYMALQLQNLKVEIK